MQQALHSYKNQVVCFLFCKRAKHTATAKIAIVMHVTLICDKYHKRAGWLSCCPQLGKRYWLLATGDYSGINHQLPITGWFTGAANYSIAVRDLNQSREQIGSCLKIEPLWTIYGKLLPPTSLLG